jgi:hypothetical protein
MEKYLLSRGSDLTIEQHETQKFFCHPVSFNVSTISCSTHVETTSDPAPRVHKHNFGHCCCRLCYAMLQSSKFCSFLLTDLILHITLEKKSSVLRPVNLEAMLGNCLFQPMCLKSVRLKTDKQFFQKVRALHLLEPYITR